MRRFLLVYFALSVLLGLMEITDGVYLSRAPLGCISALFGTLEIMWGAVSIAALVSCVKLRLNWLAPVSFVAYLFFALVYSLTFLTAEPELPRWVAITGALFGAYFAAVSLWAFLRLRETRPSADA